jgi:hypothetical protein
MQTTHQQWVHEKQQQLMLLHRMWQDHDDLYHSWDIENHFHVIPHWTDPL